MSSVTLYRSAPACTTFQQISSARPTFWSILLVRTVLFLDQSEFFWLTMLNRCKLFYDRKLVAGQGRRVGCGGQLFECPPSRNAFFIVKLCVSNTGIITFQVATFNIIPLIIVYNWDGLMEMNPKCFLDLSYVNPDFTFAVRWILGLFHWIVMILPEPWLIDPPCHVLLEELHF